MPPRKRTNKSEDSKSVAETVNSAPKDANSGETTEEYPRFEPTIYRRPRRSDGVRWFPVVKRLFYVSLLVLVPMILNYAALNHELRVLPPKGEPYLFHPVYNTVACLKILLVHFLA